MPLEQSIRSAATVDPLAERVAHWLDRLFRIPGTQVRFGLDPILGLVAPGLGDAATGAFGFYLVFAALRRGVPLLVIFQMMGNLALDAIAGSVPVLGDVFDFAFKANDKNLELMRRHAGGEPAGALAWVFVVAALLPLALLYVAVFVLVGAWIWTCGTAMPPG